MLSAHSFMSCCFYFSFRFGFLFIFVFAAVHCNQNSHPIGCRCGKGAPFWFFSKVFDRKAIGCCRGGFVSDVNFGNCVGVSNASEKIRKS